MCSPDDIGISVSYPLPGTKFFDAVQAQLGKKQNWQDSSDLAMLYQGPFSTDFYRQLHTVIHKEFRARKLWKSTKKRFDLRDVVRLSFNMLTLPTSRWKLRRLAVGGENTFPLPHMDYEQAATPTLQEVERGN
jgi:anaerobic magnesium-protoporphyrin IX monomethyl ester cyclase